MITALCQDSDGFIWAGTLNGLTRYDGTRFKTFMPMPNDPYSPADNSIYGILEDSKGRIWVGYDDELDCYDRKTGRFYHLGQKLAELNNAKILGTLCFEAADGHLWIKGDSAIIEMVVPDDFPAKPNQAQAIRCTPFRPRKGIKGEVNWTFLTHLPDAGIGVSWLDGVQMYFDSNTRTWHNMPATPTPEDVKTNRDDMFFDPKRNGYWSLNHPSLHFIKEQRVEETYTLPENLENAQFTKGLHDKQGSLFVGTNGYGMVHIIPKNTHFSHTLKGKSLREISIFQQDTLWVTLGEKLHKVLPTGQFTQQFIKSKPSISPIYMLKAADGRLFSTYQQGSFFLNVAYPDGRVADIPIPFTYLKANTPLFEDKQERLWLSNSWGDLACLPKGAKTMQYFDLKPLWGNKKLNYIPLQIYQSQNGVLWIPTYQGLVEVHAPEGKEPSFKLWQTKPTDPLSLSSNTLLSVLDDPAAPDRYLWVTTSGAGFNKMDKQTGQCLHFTQKDGLPNDVVYGILNDAQGRLWMSTNYGLSCFNPATLHFRNFTVEDGLQDNEFNSYSYYKFPDGRIAFGGVNGLTVFNPDKITPDKAHPPVFFTELRINNKLINLRDESGILNEPIEFIQKIHLAYNQNFISVGYAALDFLNRENKTFYYKMDGVDPDWVYADKRTEVNYPNLSSGTYTLHVTNVNENGEKNPQVKTITFIISPPWWRTWTAYFVYALLLGFGIWRVFKFEVKRVKLQNELVYNQKEAKYLQALDALKTNFFTNITHEFRTPLTLIIEPARQIHETAVSNAMKKQSNIILNNANRLLLLVNQLLDISKVEDNKIQAHWSEGDVLPIVQDIVEWFEPAIQKKNQTLTFKTDLQALQGMTDRFILEKIVYNLLSNAYKFTPENGSIALTIAQPNADTWQIVVQDTGIGITADQLPHIFDRFYQADNTLTRRNEGSGIGLALVNELCKLLQGTIDVESFVGMGTKFTIRLPIRPNTEGGLVAAVQSISALPQTLPIESPVETLALSDTDNPQTVLIVEDNADMREYLNLILTQNGFAVLESENGKLGVEQALETVPDVIITDVMMPEMDGYALTETLKSNPITSHIPIVILTAKGRQESKIEGYRRGADAYLPKPFNTEELLVRLRQLLEVRRKLQEKYQATHWPPGNTGIEQVSEDALSIYDTTLSNIDAQWIQDLERIIRENMGSDTFVSDDLPTLMLMSRTQFFSKVKALTGLTPAIMIRNARLDSAYQLLMTQSQATVQDVIVQVGLNDVKTFTALFKQRFGVTPKQVILNR
jgi:signal transduction histidine kinase/AraC-like DNA-binding protein/AmiR/NasT family two-component response regulator/streptogramin lyase